MVSGTFRFLNKHSWLEKSESLENLSMFNDLVKISENYKEKPGQAADFMIKETLLQSLLARARASHNRPTWQTDAYIELLEEIVEHLRNLLKRYVLCPRISVERRRSGDTIQN